ncbi:MAG: GNAT family N-acetyltransferase [Nocardioidaceae bacterium]
MSDIRITISTRRGRATDRTSLEDVAVEAYLPYVDRLRGQRPAPMDTDYAAAITRDVVWISEVDGQIAGFLVLVDQPGYTLLESVAVRPRWQGRGIGRRLITIAEEHARAMGTNVVRLYTNAAMVENQGLYVRLGYVEVDRRVEDRFDRVFYEKVLVL